MSGGYDASKLVNLDVLLNQDFFDEVNAYAKKVREKGATLLFWFSPINQLAARFTDEEAATFMTNLEDALDCPILGSVTETVYEAPYFFDTNYHLNDTGAIMHTEKTVAKILEYLATNATASGGDQ